MALTTIEQGLVDFIERVKDDPELSQLFRDAANELHKVLCPPKKPAPKKA